MYSAPSLSDTLSIIYKFQPIRIFHFSTDFRVAALARLGATTPTPRWPRKQRDKQGLPRPFSPNPLQRKRPERSRCRIESAQNAPARPPARLSELRRRCSGGWRPLGLNESDRSQAEQSRAEQSEGGEMRFERRGGEEERRRGGGNRKGCWERN